MEIDKEVKVGGTWTWIWMEARRGGSENQEGSRRRRRLGIANCEASREVGSN